MCHRIESEKDGYGVWLCLHIPVDRGGVRVARFNFSHDDLGDDNQ